MLQRADIAGARPVILIEATTPSSAVGDAKQEAFDRLSQLALGKEFQAQVLSRLTDGSYLVKIDEAVASMKLPPGTKTGDVVDLTLLATQPRPTFLLGKPDAGATTQLSNAGRLIGNMLQMAQQDGAPPTAVVGKTPLVATPNTPPAQIAAALQNAVTFSGLFYESHVAQWANGTRPLAQLFSEPPAKTQNSTPTGATPQAQTPGQPAPGAERTIPAQQQPLADLSKLMANVKELVSGDRTLPEVLNALKAGITSSQDNPDQLTAARQDPATNTEAVKLVSLQLDTLEQRRIVWQGELFPGQPMEWEISDDTPKRNGDGAFEQPEQQSWQSTVRFSLPTLGAVSATIRLTGEHVQVNVRTANEGTATALRTYGGMLADALGAAGSTLDSLLVKHDE
jgi:hypothetical protein